MVTYLTPMLVLTMGGMSFLEEKRKLETAVWPQQVPTSLVT